MKDDNTDLIAKKIDPLSKPLKKQGIPKQIDVIIKVCVYLHREIAELKEELHRLKRIVEGE